MVHITKEPCMDPGKWPGMHHNTIGQLAPLLQSHLPNPSEQTAAPSTLVFSC